MSINVGKEVAALQRMGARTLISRAGRAFRERVCSLLAARQIDPLAGPLAVQIEVFPPDHRRRDIDNLQKALLDALQHGGAYFDDTRRTSSRSALINRGSPSRPTCR